MPWCSSCSSCARAASKSVSVICGVDDASVPPPVACGLSTVRHENWLPSIALAPEMVSPPTLPAEPATTATMLTPVAVPPHLTIVSPEVCANSILLELTRRWPRYRRIPGLVWPPPLHWFVYVTWPMAGASCTCLTPVVLKPWESDLEIVVTRTRIGALPG